MLAALGVDRVALLTSNPDKVAQLAGLGLTIVEQVPTGVFRGPANAAYLAAKNDRFARTLTSEPQR
jgi:GTP cyclohydrolase II